MTWNDQADPSDPASRRGGDILSIIEIGMHQGQRAAIFVDP